MKRHKTIRNNEKKIDEIFKKMKIEIVEKAELEKSDR